MPILTKLEIGKEYQFLFGTLLGTFIFIGTSSDFVYKFQLLNGGPTVYPLSKAIVTSLGYYFEADYLSWFNKMKRQDIDQKPYYRQKERW